MTHQNGVSHAHRVGHEHRHAHEHAHTTRQRLNPYGILASEIAQHPVEHWLIDLEARSQALGLYKFLFPFSTRRSTKDRASSRQPNVSAAKDDTPENIMAAEEAFGIAAVLGPNITTACIGVEDQTLLDRIIPYLADPINEAPEPLPEDAGKDARFDSNNYGRLLLSPPRLAKALRVEPKRLSAVRKQIASQYLPIGLGWTSLYEYRYFLATYLFNTDTSSFPPVETEELRTFELKRRSEKALGKESVALWALFEHYARYQLDSYINHGVEARLPRSATRLAKSFSCAIDLAGHLIELLRQLPRNPLEDILGLQPAPKGQRRKITPRRPEARLVWNERDGRYHCQWMSTIAERIAGLKDPATQAYMDVLWSVVQQQEGKKQVNLDTVLAEAGRIAPGLDQENLLDYADQLLLAAGDEKLVKQGMEIERAGGNGGDKVSRTGSITGQMSRLNAIHKIYTSLLEAIQLKPRLIEFVANYQKDYLSDGRQELLKPLTKARIVRALGFESSGGSRKSNARSQREKELMNTGRRLERYMKHLWILLPDGNPIALERLIPGPGGVKDTANTALTVITVKEYMKEIIAGEDKGFPYSDQKISELLHDQYGVRIARKTVAKYREGLGVLCSQRRVQNGEVRNM